MKILREAMIRVVVPPFTIRVWREERVDSCPVGAHQRNTTVETEVKQTVTRLHGVPYMALPVEIAKEILELNGVNAVEVLDTNGNGDVLYKDWP